uniref:Uncharacterized protein n=1 Tax=Toxoplasma gondii (strain ATCC 50861 / VEG) TaxID=432359 RepID=A0A0F7VC56_TOXGV|nr:TPA: hypothetical protein BN1205_007060 [Toxoplasma gondii VEG]
MQSVRLPWKSVAPRCFERSGRALALEASRASVRAQDCRCLSRLSAHPAASQTREELVLVGAASRETTRFSQGAVSSVKNRPDGYFADESTLETHARPSILKARVEASCESVGSGGPHFLKTVNLDSRPTSHSDHAKHEDAGAKAESKNNGIQRGTRIRLKQLDLHASVRRSKSVEEVLEICAQFLREVKDEIGDCCQTDATRREDSRHRRSAMNWQTRDLLSTDPAKPPTEGSNFVARIPRQFLDIPTLAVSRPMAVEEESPSNEHVSSGDLRRLPLSASALRSLHADDRHDLKTPSVAGTEQFPSPSQCTSADSTLVGAASSVDVSPRSSASPLGLMGVCSHLASDFGWINSAHVLHRLALLSSDTTERNRWKTAHESLQQTRENLGVQQLRRARRIISSGGSTDADRQRADKATRPCKGDGSLPTRPEVFGVQDVHTLDEDVAGNAAPRDGIVKWGVQLLRDARFLSVLCCVLHHLRQTHETLLSSELDLPVRGLSKGISSLSNIESSNLVRGVCLQQDNDCMQVRPQTPEPVPVQDRDHCNGQLHSVTKKGAISKEGRPIVSAFSQASAAVEFFASLESEEQAATPPPAHTRKDSSGTDLPISDIAGIKIPPEFSGTTSRAVGADERSSFQTPEVTITSPPRFALETVPGTSQVPFIKGVRNTAPQRLQEQPRLDAPPYDQTNKGSGLLFETPGDVALEGREAIEKREPTAAQLRFVASLCWACGKLRLPAALRESPTAELQNSNDNARNGPLSDFHVGLSLPYCNRTQRNARLGEEATHNNLENSAANAHSFSVRGAQPSERSSNSSQCMRQGTRDCSPGPTFGGTDTLSVPSRVDPMGGRRLYSEIVSLLEKCVLRCLPFFRPRELSLGLWGIAQCHAARAASSSIEDGRGRSMLRIRQAFWQQAVACVRRRLPEMPLRELSMFAQTCCTVGYRDETLMVAVADAMLVCLPTEWKQYHRWLMTQAHKKSAAATSSSCKNRQRSIGGNVPNSMSGACTKILDVDTRSGSPLENTLCFPSGARQSFLRTATEGRLDSAAVTTLGANLSFLLYAFASLDMPVLKIFRAVAALLLDDRDSAPQGSVECEARHRFIGDSVGIPLAIRRNNHLPVPHRMGQFLASLEPSHVTSLAWAYSTFIAGSARGSCVEHAEMLASKDLGGAIQSGAHKLSRTLLGQSRNRLADEARCRLVSQSGERLNAVDGESFEGENNSSIRNRRTHFSASLSDKRSEQQLLFELSAYLATHALTCSWRYSTAEKVQLCWALSLQDIFIPSFLWSALTELESASRHSTKSARIRATADGSQLPIDIATGMPGESAEPTGLRAGNLYGRSGEGLGSTDFGGLLDVQPLKDTLLPHKLQTQLYLSTLSFLTRGEVSLVFGSAEDWDKCSPASREGASPQPVLNLKRQKQQSRFAAESGQRKADEFRSSSAVHRGAIKAVPTMQIRGPLLSETGNSPSLTISRCGLERALERAGVEQISLPMAFFRCRAALDTHPDRTPHYVVSPLHIKVFIELRKILHTREEIRQQPTCVLLERVFDPHSVVGKLAEKHRGKEGDGASTRRTCDPRWDVVPEYRDSSGFWLDILVRPRAEETAA